MVRGDTNHGGGKVDWTKIVGGPGLNEGDLLDWDETVNFSRKTAGNAYGDEAYGLVLDNGKSIMFPKEGKPIFKGSRKTKHVLSWNTWFWRKASFYSQAPNKMIDGSLHIKVNRKWIGTRGYIVGVNDDWPYPSYTRDAFGRTESLSPLPPRIWHINETSWLRIHKLIYILSTKILPFDIK